MPLDRIGGHIMVPVPASRQQGAGFFLPLSFVFQGNTAKLPPRILES